MISNIITICGKTSYFIDTYISIVYIVFNQLWTRILKVYLNLQPMWICWLQINTVRPSWNLLVELEGEPKVAKKLYARFERKIKQNHDVCVNTSNLVDIKLWNGTEDKCIFPVIRPRLFTKKQTSKSTLSNLSILPTTTMKNQGNNVSLASLNSRSVKN